MTKASLGPGKLPVDLLAALLREFGPPPPEVSLGPAIGEDACAVEMAGGVLVAATDPITLTGTDSGWLAVVVNANDIAVMGVRPRWFLAAVMLPLGTTEEAVQGLFADMRRALGELEVSIVGGHCEITAAVRQPLVVGQMLGFSEDSRFVTTGGASPGDVVVQVGPAPIEGVAVLAVEASERLASLPRGTVQAAADATRRPGIAVVDAALAAADLGATALHDPTEGGLASGLHEVAAAADVGLRIDRQQVCWFGPGLAVCECLGADPWATLASGALLATFRPDRVDTAIEMLAARGHVVAKLGVVVAGSGVHDTDGRPIPRPDRDEVARLLS